MPHCLLKVRLWGCVIRSPATLSADHFNRCLESGMGMRVLSRIVSGGVDRRVVPTVTSVLIGSKSWLYNINIQPL